MVQHLRLYALAGTPALRRAAVSTTRLDAAAVRALDRHDIAGHEEARLTQGIAASGRAPQPAAASQRRQRLCAARAISVPDEEDAVDPGRCERFGEVAMQPRGVVAELEHVAEHGDAPAARRRLGAPSTASAARIAAGLAL